MSTLKVSSGNRCVITRIPERSSRSGLLTQTYRTGGRVNPIVNLNAMPNELEQLIADEDKEKSETSSDDSQKTEKSEDESSSQKNQIDEEIRSKEEHLAHVQAAIDAENQRLKEARAKANAARIAQDSEEEPILKVDLTDPSAKAWDKHIRDTVAPAQSILDKEKDEVRTAALETFLKAKPALAKDPEKVKSLMEEYERLSSGKITELQRDGVSLYLSKAYASLYHDVLTDPARLRQFSDAQADIDLTESAVDSGATTYPREREYPKENLTAEDRETILNMYGSLDEYYKAVKDSKSSE